MSKEWTTWREYHLNFFFLNLKTFWVKRRTYFERFKWMHKVKTFNLYWIIIIRKVSFEVHTFLSTITQKANAQMNKWERVFMNGPSKICGRQPLKKLKWYGLLKQFFKSCLPQILLDPQQAITCSKLIMLKVNNRNITKGVKYLQSLQ